MGSDDDSNQYEVIRRQRLEENKRRMQELGISELSESLSKAAQKSNSKTVKQRIPKEDFPIEVRRSSRTLDGPRPNYRDDAFDIRLPRRSGPRIAGLPIRYASDIERIKAAESANKLQEELQNGNPSFVKPMLISHVSGGFWLGLPLHFCKKNLPHNDGIIVLEDESGDEWDSIYLAHRNGLSGGWRGFSVEHRLEDGDALVFELLQPRRFKVHIIRVSQVVSNNDNKENTITPKQGLKRKPGDKNVKTENGRKVTKKGKKSPTEKIGKTELQKNAKPVNRKPLVRSPKLENCGLKSAKEIKPPANNAAKGKGKHLK